MPWSTSRPRSDARGYGAEHRAERQRWLDQLKADGFGACCICGGVIAPGMKLHLDHSPDRQSYRGLSHARCNVRDGAKRGRARQNSSPLRW